MEVITVSTGDSITLVASSLPPSPVSSTAASTFSFAKNTIAIANRYSKNDGCSPPASCKRSTAFFTVRKLSTNCSFVLFCSLICIRSSMQTRCGEIKSPVRVPFSVSTWLTALQTLPFPLLPATWITAKSRSGCPKQASSLFVCSGLCFTVNFGISSI